TFPTGILHPQKIIKCARQFLQCCCAQQTQLSQFFGFAHFFLQAFAKFTAVAAPKSAETLRKIQKIRCVSDTRFSIRRQYTSSAAIFKYALPANKSEKGQFPAQSGQQ